MKLPRTSDFDPSAKARQLKSSMVDLPTIEKPEQMQPPDRRLDSVPPGLPDRPVPNEPSTTPSRRKIKARHGFDVYEDQVEALRKLALEDRMRGGVGSMSAMVREAIDDYLAKVRA
jgi:hypothetical protein